MTDQHIATSTSLVSMAVTSLKREGVEALVYDQVAVEPTDQSVQAAISFALNVAPFDGIISLGGGSGTSLSSLSLHSRPSPHPI